MIANCSIVLEETLSSLSTIYIGTYTSITIIVGRINENINCINSAVYFNVRLPIRKFPTKHCIDLLKACKG